MKNLHIAAAATLALAVSIAPNLASESVAAQAKRAQAKSPYCDMAKSQRDPVSWNARYGCLDKEALAAARAEARLKR